MAMNKKEQAYVRELEEKILQLEALKLRSDKIEPDLPPPSNGSFLDLAKGWSFNSYNNSVEKSCSSSIYHGFGWDKTSSQNPIRQFSSKKLALKALRYAVEQKFAKELADIDKRIKESGNE